MKISVVIRTKDKEKYFDSLMENLALQTVQVSEIIVADNFSTKQQLQSLKRDLEEIKRKHFKNQRIKLISYSNGEFSHAYSTNLAVNMAENELVCITNAHSLPTSPYWLQVGLKHFEDPKVAGVSGFFLPHKEAAVFGRCDSTLYYLSQKLSAHPVWCSTINCIIRKSLWAKYPFDENLPKIIPETSEYGSEDYDWSREMAARGFRIVIEPFFSVFHSHHEKLNEMSRNVRNYFVYRKLQQKINSFSRPRSSSTSVFQTKDFASRTIDIFA
ncbi:MAG TPA: glycosyltransferase family A protein [Candidatus Bathyarchaeia archaeon]|nr:glycosyltransferase family A protein [Candidatus Bathyarchaeia archaeon]